jgi:hypothetical protein
MTLLDANVAIKAQIPFYNIRGSYYYIRLKVKLAEEYLFYANGGMHINGAAFIPETLDSIQALSRRYNIPKSSLHRALLNMHDDGGWVDRVGHSPRGVKYEIVLTPERAKEFLDLYHLLRNSKKPKKTTTHGTFDTSVIYGIKK